MCSSTSESSDIISHLPENVIEQILMCLPLQDAVRTSVLSKKWRYIWAKLPKLVFDDRFCKESIRMVKNELMMTIYQILLLHRGPILNFTLSLSGLESCSEIDPLIVFVSNNGIQHFTLWIWKGEPYKLPPSLFSCPRLKHLNLRSCIFKPPLGFKGFSQLLCLELHEVVVAAEILSSLISSCPLLERLTLESTTTFSYLEIVAPNLRFLNFRCLVSSICFRDTHHLARVSLSLKVPTNGAVVFKDGETSNSVVLLGSLPGIEFLELDYYYVQYMAAGSVSSKRLPTTLSHLKFLKLLDVCFAVLDEVSSVLRLISSSPNLNKISVRAFTLQTDVTDSVLEVLGVQGSDFSLNQLREVEMLKVSGTRPEFEFIKLLLAISPMLETMLIESDSKKVADKGLSILKEVTRFRRLSPLAEITYKDEV